MANTVLGGGGDTIKIPGDVRIEGDLNIGGSTTGVARSNLTQDTTEPYTLRPEGWKTWDDMDTPLPSAGATDDLGIVGGTFATGSPSLQTEDLKADGATANRARRTFALPPEYDDGQTITIRLHAGMLTTIADGTATVDVEVYKCDEEAGIGSDLCTTAATDINSVTLGDKDFVITPAGLAPGDLLDIRISTAINDGATATAVIGIIGAAKVLLDIRG